MIDEMFQPVLNNSVIRGKDRSSTKNSIANSGRRGCSPHQNRDAEGIILNNSSLKNGLATGLNL